ncbi:MAG: hypothetical protein K8T10_08515 [Candidatus Eremiobacteraeota bacterium]|nr:hypothetical protein [Candidatus Eremiobacteraeota bacterium]
MKIRPNRISEYSYNHKSGTAGKRTDSRRIRESVTLESGAEVAPDKKLMLAAARNKESWSGESSETKTSWLSSLGRKTGWMLAGIALLGSVGLVGCNPGTSGTDQKENTPIEQTIDETEEKTSEAMTEKSATDGENDGSIIDYQTPQGRKSLKDWAKKAKKIVGNPSEAVQLVKEAAKEITRENLEEVKDKVVKEVKEFIEKDSKEAVEAAKKVVEGDKSELKENIKELVEKGKEYGQKKLTEVKDATDKAGKVAGDARETLNEVREGFNGGEAEKNISVEK